MNGSCEAGTRRCAARACAVLAWLVALGWTLPLAAAVRILDSPNVTLARPARVTALAEQPDGKLLVGGTFDRVNGERTSRLVRLNPDGTRDATFNVTYTGFPSFDVIVLAPDGTIYVGGNFFIDIQGQTRRSLLKLAPDGTLDAAWNPDPSNAVRALVLDGSTLYVGGAFASIGGQTRNRIARIDALGTGSADPAWNPNASGFVNDMLKIGGALVVSGQFTTIGGQSRPRMAKLDAATGVADPLWDPSTNAVDPRALADPGDGTVLVGGVFATLGGQPRSNLARLSLAGTGAADPAWTAGTDGAVNFILVEPPQTGAADAPVDAGDVTIGGLFSTVATRPRVRIARLRDNGDVVDGYGPSIQVSRHALPLINEAVIGLQDPQLRVVVAGQFDSIDGAAAFAIGRIGVGGQHDASFTASIQIAPLITTLALDPQTGAAYLGGQFSVVDDQYPLKNLARLARGPDLPNGDPQFSLDALWSFNTGDPLFASSVTALQIIGRRLFVGGRFASLGGVARTNLGAIDLDTAQVDGWQVPVTGTAAEAQVMALAAAGADTLYAAGYFETIGGQPIRYVARLGTAVPALVDPTFAPNPDQVVGGVLPLGSGSVLFGGVFAQVGGQPRPWFARWPTGASEPQLGVTLDGPVDRMLRLVDNSSPTPRERVYAAGRYTLVDGGAAAGGLLFDTAAAGSVAGVAAPAGGLGPPFGVTAVGDCIVYSRGSAAPAGATATVRLMASEITASGGLGVESELGIRFDTDLQDAELVGGRFLVTPNLAYDLAGSPSGSDVTVYALPIDDVVEDGFENRFWAGSGCNIEP